MKKLGSIRRMASEIAKCGKNKLWFSPNDFEKILAADSKERVRELLKTNIIVPKEDKHNSRARSRARAVAKSKGRHMGKGSKKGTANARNPKKKVWMKTLRSMRAELKKMKEDGKLDHKEYRDYRQKAKGNLFRQNKKVMIQFIEKKKAEEKRVAELRAQAEALSLKNAAAK